MVVSPLIGTAVVVVVVEVVVVVGVVVVVVVGFGGNKAGIPKIIQFNLNCS